jgi:cytochrome b involved in lipid metabolism/uncharacterized membrane protein
VNAPSALVGVSAESGIFDTIAGLPMHPLVVHVAVVILPLSALGLLAIIVVPRWRRTFGWLTLAGLAVGVVGAFAAKESGEALAARVGLPEDHARLGDVLPLVAGALLVVAVAWYLLDRRRTEDSGSLWPLVLAAAAAILALAVIVMTILVGHSGAQATWSGKVVATSTTSTPRPAPTVSGDALTMAAVQAHADPSDCWTVVDGTVYDLTTWISEHPGGPGDIEAMCGLDATDAFLAQHGGEQTPTKVLDGFALGPLAAPAAAAPSAVAATPVVHRSVPTAKRYTRAQVRQHRTATDCWTIIDRTVYDLTDWVRKHPGGASRIIAICGRDGTRAFDAQHARDTRAATYLASYRIGRLVRPAAA